MENKRTYVVTEVCPNCEKEVELVWDTDTDGYQIFCPSCGEKMMLCDDCRHSPDTQECDFHWLDESKTIGTCFRQKAQSLKNVNELKTGNSDKLISAAALMSEINKWPETVMYKDWVQSAIANSPAVETLSAIGNLLKQKGYDVKVLNLIDMEKSHCYNPSDYLRDDNDIQKGAENYEL